MSIISAKSPRHSALRIGETDYSHKQVTHYYDSEIKSLINVIIDESVSENLKISVRRYLLLRLFSALEYYFHNEARLLVDNNNLDVRNLFNAKNRLKLEKILRQRTATKGQIVASTYNFADIYDIEFVFSRLLYLDSFLDYIAKLNDIDQTRYVLDGHPIPIKYENFRKSHITRNYLAHHIRETKISKTMIISLWDNFLNMIDISTTIFMSASDEKLRVSLDSDYDYGIERQRRKSIYKLVSDQIMSNLQKNQILLLDKVGDKIVLQESIMDSFEDSLKDKITNVLYKMREQELIHPSGNSIRLTLNGKNRFKRTTNFDREQWKIDVFENRIASDDKYLREIEIE